MIQAHHLLLLFTFPFRGCHSGTFSFPSHLSSASVFATATKRPSRFNHIQKSSLWSFPFSPGWQLHLQYPSKHLFTIPPLYVSKSSQSSLSYFISETSNPGCSSDVLLGPSAHPVAIPLTFLFPNSDLQYLEILVDICTSSSVSGCWKTSLELSREYFHSSRHFDCD